MSEATSSDIFADKPAYHGKLDYRVNLEARRLFMDGLCDWAGLLSLIIEHSDEQLDPKYRDIPTARKKLEEDFNLDGKLREAWASKSYREIRNWEPLWTSKTQMRMKGIDLQRAFTQTYPDDVPDAFYKYLERNNALFSDPGIFKKYYGKFCAVIQSSGTGKSRLLTELSKKGVIVLYMNLGATDNGFPSRDEVPAKILTEHLNVSSQLYEARCCTFFAVVFHLLGSELSRLLEHASMDAVAAIDLWNKGMCDMLSNARSEFFGRVQSEYEWLKYSYFDNAQGPKEKVTTDLRWYMCRAYGKMISDLPQLFKFREDTGINEPKLVIAIDDAQPLWETNEEFRPADILCKTISFYSSSSEYESNSAWVVFASTSPKVATCVVPQPQICDSARFAERGGEPLFPPYTLLGWDSKAPSFDSLSGDNTGRLEDVIGFGRPLWASLKVANYKVSDLVHIAQQKLCGDKNFDPSDVNHVVAILGQRFCLEIQGAYELAEDGVASHLRILHGITQDRYWIHTGYSSEPFLSCIAASLLHREGSLQGCLSKLQEVFSGVVSPDGGQLAGRLFWSLAKDLLVRAKGDDLFVGSRAEEDWNVELNDCRIIPLLTYLEFLFGRHPWPQAALKTFKDAYVNFSHWAVLKEFIGTNMDSTGDWTLHFWQRALALQCHREQSVDKVIPIYFKPQAESSVPEEASQMFISNHFSRHKDNRSRLDHISRKDPMIDCASTIPYIAIVVDLGQPDHAFEVQWATADDDAPSLRIYAAGLDPTTFPFLNDHPYIVDTVQHLVPRFNSERRRLLDSMRIGSSIAKRHAYWELNNDGDESTDEEELMDDRWKPTTFSLQY